MSIDYTKLLPSLTKQALRRYVKACIKINDLTLNTPTFNVDTPIPEHIPHVIELKNAEHRLVKSIIELDNNND